MKSTEVKQAITKVVDWMFPARARYRDAMKTLNGTKLYPFQQEGVGRMAYFNGRALLADEMGLGKTIQSLVFSEKFTVGPTIVVCPAYLKWNWRDEIKKHMGWKVAILSRTKRKIVPLTPRRIYVINYEILGSWMEYLSNLNADLLILDECEYVKSLTAKRTKRCQELASNFEYVLALSGTPLTNRPAELWPSLNMVRPDKYRSYWDFGMKFCLPEKSGGRWKFKGACNLDVLHKRLKKQCMIRRRMRDVFKDMPPKLRHVVPLEIERRSEYELAVNNFAIWIRGKFGAGKAIRAIKSQQITKLGYLKRLAAELKLKSVIAWIEDFLEQTDKRLIVAGYHRSFVEAIYQKFRKQSILVHGGITGEKRHKRFNWFNRSKKKRLLVGNIQSIGRGWSCRATSKICVAELIWTPGEHAQLEKRIEGINRGVKGEPPTAYYLIAKGTIEERLCEALQIKQRVLDAVLDGKVTDDGIDIFDILTRALLKEAA